MLKTTDFGIVPLIMTSWNASISTGTFQIWPNWGFYYFQNSTNAISLTNLQSEIQAVTTIYSAERVTVLSGFAFDLTGAHIENPKACTTFIDDGGTKQVIAGFRSGVRTLTREISLNQYKPANKPTPAQLALFYCQQSFPFILADTGASGSITLQNNMFGQLSTGASDPIIIDWLSPNQMHLVVRDNGRQRNNLSLFNPSIRVTQQIQAPISGGYNYIYTPALGAGEWSQTPFLPTNGAAGNAAIWMDGNWVGHGTLYGLASSSLGTPTPYARPL